MCIRDRLYVCCYAPVDFGICVRHSAFRTPPAGASGSNSEAVLGPAQFKLRAPRAIVYVRQGRLRNQAD
eukprot:14660192-Alexandrium_andersonii.AAC.1